MRTNEFSFAIRWIRNEEVFKVEGLMCAKLNFLCGINNIRFYRTRDAPKQLTCKVGRTIISVELGWKCTQNH